MATFPHIFPLGYQQKGRDHFISVQLRHKISFSFLQVSIFCGRLLGDYVANQIARTKMLVATAFKAWFPYSCICRVCRSKKIHRTTTTLRKPPIQMLNTKETTDTTCCTRWNEFYLSYEFFSYDRHDRYNDMETRLKSVRSLQGCIRSTKRTSRRKAITQLQYPTKSHIYSNLLHLLKRY